MGLFNKEKTNYRLEMHELLKNFMLEYVEEFPKAADAVIPIFSNADQMIKNTSEKELSTMLKRNKTNVEHAVLNIVQNWAMTELKPKTGADFLMAEDYALNLYDYVNNMKYERGYISKEQFEENKLLAIQLSLVPPLGTWG